MTTFVFPGQGSQKPGMGADLFDTFNDITAKADEILGYSVKALCLEAKEAQLNQTLYTQPALYVVNALHLFQARENSAPEPNFVAGHSLGEYNALLAAGVYDFATGLRLVKKRAELMNEASGGGMAAIIGLSADNINTILSDNDLKDVTIANYNTSEQIVITGLKTHIEQAHAIFEQNGAKMVVPLNVSGAFHSRYMDDAQATFRQFLDDVEVGAPTIPVIANLTALPYETNAIKDTLAKQINHSVRWTESIQYLITQGEQDFVEMGPGKVLTGLIRRIVKETNKT